MSLPARVKVFLLSFAFLIPLSLSILPAPSYAQVLNGTSPDTASETNSDVADTYHNRAQVLFIDVSAALICQLSGIDVLNPQQGCLGIDQTSGKIGYAQQQGQQSRGLIGFAFQNIGSLYTQPVSSSQFVHYLASNFGISHPALAQDKNAGSFKGFEPLQAIFVTIRNISFFFMIILFVLIGVAIMLRLKIDPRTVMTIQNQIPKIVVTILLISFSYAIAGLLADGMWLLTYSSINLLGGIAQNECTQTNPKNTFPSVGTANILNNPMAYTRDLFSDAGCFGKWDGLSGLSTTIGLAMGDVLTGTIFEAIGLDADNLNGDCHVTVKTKFLVIPVGIGGVGNCAEIYIYRFVSWVIGLIAILVVLIAMFIALIRLWFTLIKAYVYILLDVCTAPLQIVMGLMPGSTFGFMHWVRHITAYLLIYPATAAALMTAVIFALAPGINGNGSNLNNTFIPPLVGNPLITENMGALIAFGIILVLPELLEMIKDALKVKNSQRATQAVVSGFGRGVSVTQSIGGAVAPAFKGHDGGPSPIRTFGRMTRGAFMKTAPGQKVSSGVAKVKDWNDTRKLQRWENQANYKKYREDKTGTVPKPSLGQRVIRAPGYELTRAGDKITSPASVSVTGKRFDNRLAQMFKGHEVPRNPLWYAKAAGEKTGHALNPKSIYGFFRRTRQMYEEEMAKSVPNLRLRTDAIAMHEYQQAKKETGPLSAKDVTDIKEYLKRMSDPNAGRFDSLTQDQKHTLRAQVRAAQEAGKAWRRIKPRDLSGAKDAEWRAYWEVAMRARGAYPRYPDEHEH